MRVFISLLKIVLTLSVVSALVFFVSREALLYWSTRQMKEALVGLRNAGAAPGNYVDDCAQFDTTDRVNSRVQSLELTFLNDTEYQFQVVCQNYPYEPLTFKKYQLAPFVTKVPGSAGFVWSETAPSVVTLEIWGRKQHVVFTKAQTTVNQGRATFASTLVPQAVCKAYGFQCCATDSAQGSGEQAVGVTDCPQTCFSQCLTRPVILSFNTQPFFDPKTRLVSIFNGQEVSFSYTTNLPTTRVGSVVLDFGDNQTYQSASPSGTVAHSYVCSAASCEYSAALTVTDTSGLTNDTNIINQVKILVQP